ncbi:hypothetical protein HPB48_018944 [Haemaphysalis longicornis]|uniref:Endonuclease/exonuclease/phosphatase domain-containing protein n=1 Tax=Haemaphysalis longicornis TaxID=44386 RepID=A0A9J6FGN6_HAELO|nr:hypothetical protein HPB48_018944 [Haemaphysalis longicornis]
MASNGSSGNARPQNNTTTTNNAVGLRKGRRRERLGPRNVHPTIKRRWTPKEGPASGEEAAAAETVTTATIQIPGGGELTAIFQLHTLSVTHERLALKVATTSLRNRFASLKKERAEGTKVATNRFASLKKRGRLETSEEDDAEANKKHRKKRGRDATVIYQWNCRGIRNKEAELLLHIDGQENKPDIIALQETNGKPRLPGYVSYTDPTENGTAVLVRSNGRCEYTLVEIYAREIANSGNVFAMSGYCGPSQRQYEYDHIVIQAKGLAGTRPLLILGDFNAPHPTGKSLAKAMEDNEMALLNEPHVPTRRGNCAARDTTPDLSWFSAHETSPGGAKKRTWGLTRP